MGVIVHGVELEKVTATLSRASYADALAMSAPDVEINVPPVEAGSSVLVVRVAGPVSTQLVGGTDVTPGRGAFLVVDPADGRSLHATILMEGDDEGPISDLPKVDDQVETDVTDFPLAWA